MPDYSFSQSEAARHHCLQCSGPVVIDLADTDIYVAAAAISQKLPGLLCIKRKQATILCHNLVPEEMACRLHCTATLPHQLIKGKFP